MATVLAQYGAYHCGECLQVLLFEPVPEAWGTQLDSRGFAVGVCTNTFGKCERAGVRLKVKLQTIEVEELPPLHEENPRATQTEDRPAAAD